MPVKLARIWSVGLPSESPVTSTRFQPGDAWRGNAKGRPPLAEVPGERVRERDPDATRIIDQLWKIAFDPHRDIKSRLVALTLLLAYGWGKPQDNLKLSGSLATLDPAKLARLSDAELEQAAHITAKLLAEEG